MKSGKVVSLLLLVLIAAHAVVEGQLSTRYRFSSALSGDDYILHWNVDQQQKMVAFAVNVSTTGWVGLGLSPNGQMPASDVVIGWVDSNGQVTFQDRYAVGRFRPPIDESQDWILTSGEERNGRTILEFNRPFLSCDVDNDLDILPGTSRIVWAYHSQDPSSEEELGMLRHERMGSTSLNLMNLNEDRVEENSASFTILHDNVEIPNGDTTYWCSVHALPSEVENNEGFIYKFSPVIPPNTARFVHHLTIYLCSSLNSSHVGTSEECAGESITAVSECRVSGILFAAWAVGGTDFVFPSGVAYPIGGEETDLRYIVLETHYDNPQLIEGERDSSGLEFFYLNEEPENRAGLLTLGYVSTPSLIIPPGADNYEINGFCPSTCTQTFFPRDGINFFGNMLHTHLAGRGLVVRHFRRTDECNGIEELAPIDENRNYDFDYQQVNTLQDRRVLPGDTMLLQCFYSTTDESYEGVTLGGESTSQEMCLAFLYYYPATDLNYCVTAGPYLRIPDPFASQYLSANDQSTLSVGLQSQNHEVVSSVLNQVEWNQQAISSLRESIRSSLDGTLCLSSERPEATTFVPFILAEPDCPYVPPEKDCLSESAAMSVHHFVYALFLCVLLVLLI